MPGQWRDGMFSLHAVHGYILCGCPFGPYYYKSSQPPASDTELRLYHLFQKRYLSSSYTNVRPGLHTINFLHRLHERDPCPPVLFLNAHCNIFSTPITAMVIEHTYNHDHYSLYEVTEARLHSVEKAQRLSRHTSSHPVLPILQEHLPLGRARRVEMGHTQLQHAKFKSWSIIAAARFISKFLLPWDLKCTIYRIWCTRLIENLFLHCPKTKLEVAMSGKQDAMKFLCFCHCILWLLRCHRRRP